MRKDLTVNYYSGGGEVKEVEGGYDVVITIPFVNKGAAETCLKGLRILREVSHGRATEDN